MNDMKKIFIIMLLVLASTMALAQTSVWHGGRTVWTRGSGTENDPFLLESADNLAYLAYVVNKGYNAEGIYFRLTTDIDLNGSEDLQWVPIGSGYLGRWFNEDGCYRGNPNGGFYGCINTNPCFRGHFDGGEHSISNIYIDNSENEYGDYIGLFGSVQGKQENQEICPAVIENVFVTSGYIKGSCCGGIVGNGSRTTLVSRCWNGATIEISEGSGNSLRSGCGGIVGYQPYQVKKCYNKGEIHGYCVGGIVGVGPAEIEECYNEGLVFGTYSGGIFGSIQQGKVTINNCYNLGSVTSDGAAYGNLPAGPVAGGIAGFMFRGNSTITNCYNVGVVSSTQDAGCVLGYGPDVVPENDYYINTCDVGGEGTPQAEDVMQSQAFVDLLNGQNEEHVWAMDVNHTNSGFPILTTIDLAVPEITGQSFNVYPNPAQGCFTVEGTGRMMVSNLLGQVVMVREINGQTTVALPQGMYFVRLGNETQKIVVE